jgi:hypothetical protein
MKPPKIIRVGSVRYEVIARELEDNSITGRLLTRSQLMLLEPGMKLDCERDTVLHETLHAIFFHSGTQAGMSWDLNQEEAVVAATSPLLLDTLQRNPRLVSYLTEKD